ncbi:MAG: ABC transporter transmembrane domain-containing protein [Limnochordia bacterium]
MANRNTSHSTGLTQEESNSLPQSEETRLREMLEAGESVVQSLATDYTFEGMFGTEWLVLTNRRVLAMGPERVVSVELRDIVRVIIVDHQGNSVLRVFTQSQAHDMVRYSRTHAARFSSIPLKIEGLVQAAVHEEREIVPPEERWKAKSGRQRHRCPTCGRVVPPRMGTCPHCLDRRQLVRRLFVYVLPHWRPALMAFLLLFSATFLSLTPPLINRTLVDHVLLPAANQVSQSDSVVTTDAEQTGPADSDRLVRLLAPIAQPATKRMLVILVALQFVVHLTSSAMNGLRRFLISWLGQNITFDLRNAVYSHLQSLSLGYFARETTGRIMQRVTGDVRRLQDFLSDGIQHILQDIITLIIITSILLSMSWRLTLLIMIPTPFLIMTTLWFGRRLRRTYMVLWRRHDAVSSVLADTIPGMRVVKAFAQEEREVGRFEDRSRDVLTGELRAARINALYSPTMGMLTYMGTIIIWWLGGQRVMSGQMTLGGLMAFTNYMLRFYQPVQSLCNLNQRFQQTASSAERVFEVLDTEPETPAHTLPPAIPPIEGRVEFKNVTFAYEPGEPVLKNLSFVVEPGEMIGLVGRSGAGKSTLINLIMRFFTIDDGQITIDGHDLSQIDPKSLRDQIGVVLQEPFLFNGSIAENIAYGKPGATYAEIVAAAQAANAHEFIISFTDGYDTRVGERGTRLSGGERQRLAIARAILKSPRILILDEATSSVDTETEAKIQEALERLVKGRTTFAIAHRLSTLRFANRLFVLDKGELVEMGTHDELVAAGGIYSRLCGMQRELAQLRAV